LVVSIGAAIQGYMINNPDDTFTKNLALVDALPLSVGVESDNGQMIKIIQKGTKLPVKKQKIFTIDEDYQTEVNIKIYQGERELVKDNIMIGNFILSNLKPKIAGKNIIKIDIQVDNNCMIHVIATEKGFDNSNKITIKNNNNFYDDEIIKQMIEDAHKYDEIDSLKIKMYKLNNKLERELNNLDYNCNNNPFIKFSSEESDNLINHINNMKCKKDIIIGRFQADNIENSDYSDAIQNLKKLLKINSKKYSMLIEMYDNDKNKNIVINNESNIELVEKSSKELNDKLINIINNNIKHINTLQNISKYSKNIIISYLQNTLYKLDSITLDDKELYEDYINKIKESVNDYINNDINMINLYGNINTIKTLLQSHNITYDMMNFYNLNSLQIFDLLNDICQQFDIQIN